MLRQLTFRIIKMDCLQVVSTNHVLKLGFHLLVSFLRSDVIAYNYNNYVMMNRIIKQKLYIWISKFIT